MFAVGQIAVRGLVDVEVIRYLAVIRSCVNGAVQGMEMDALAPEIIMLGLPHG